MYFFEKKTQKFELFSKKKWLKELNIFSCMTQRIEPFWTWPNELNLLLHDSKNWTFFSKKKMTQRIEISWAWLKEFDFFYDSQTWTFLFQYFFQKKKNDSKNWSPFSLWLSKFFFFLKYEYDSQNWIFFNTTHTIELVFLNMTFFFFRHWIFLIRLKELKFSNTTQRTQLFSLIWLKVLNFFSMTLSVNWTFFFFQEIRLDSSNWISMKISSRWLKELKSFFLTQRIGLFLFPMWLKELNLL